MNQSIGLYIGSTSEPPVVTATDEGVVGKDPVNVIPTGLVSSAEKVNQYFAKDVYYLFCRGQLRNIFK